MITQSCMLIFMLLAEVSALPAGLSLGLEVNTPSPYYPELPIILAVTLTNTGSEAATIPVPTLSCRNNPNHTLEILVGDEEASLQPVSCVVPSFSPLPESITPAPPETSELGPGESWTTELVLSHDWRKDQIRSLTSGEALHVRAALCNVNDAGAVDREDRVESNGLQLTISAPTGLSASGLGKLLRTQRPWLVAHPAAVAYVAQESDFRAFQDLARMSTESVYTPYAAVVVAYMLAQGNALDRNGDRQPQPRIAELWLKQCLQATDSVRLLPDWIALAEHLDASVIPVETEPTEEQDPA